MELAAADATAREMEILSVVAEGLSNKEIGARLHISFATVRTHLMHIYEKLHVRPKHQDVFFIWLQSLDRP